VAATGQAPAEYGSNYAGQKLRQIEAEYFHSLLMATKYGALLNEKYFKLLYQYAITFKCKSRLQMVVLGDVSRCNYIYIYIYIHIKISKEISASFKVN
jgi:hypothetical protein